MELIHKIERLSLKLIRLFIPRLRKKSDGMHLMTGEELNMYIKTMLESDAAFMVARFGSIELESGLYHYILSFPLIKRYALYIRRKINYLHNDKSYASKLLAPLCNNAGFFPNDEDALRRFSKQMQYDVQFLDCCCCCWDNEDLFSKLYNPDIKFGKLEDMEPYDYTDPWSSTLQGKRVLVVHPFAKSIESQYARRELIWEDNRILPEFDLITIKAVQTIAGEKSPFSDWFEALDYMKAEMDKIEYDVAIIGCGAYGFHLAAHAKRTGHKAIHLGGATQILFGIKGKRWENIPAVLKFFNEYWVHPLPNETPGHKEIVEGGCYW